MTGERVLGVDFSGAERPGESIWIAEGRLRDGGLAVEHCRSAREVLGRRERGPLLAALVDHVGASAAVGLDFPFGLPRPVVEELGGPAAWHETVVWVGETFADAEAFTERCQAAALATTDGDRTYLKRATDGPVGAKSPYHFFTFRQAFHGMRDVLKPLLERGAAVRPMVDGNEPAVVEVYPAGTLRRLELPDQNYKKSTEESQQTRARILSGLEAGGDPANCAAGDTPESTDAAPRVTLRDDVSRNEVLGDADGDALDSVVAAVAAARALDAEFEPDDDRYDALEGYIYV